jgi:hypothetical protein
MTIGSLEENEAIREVANDARIRLERVAGALLEA